MYYNGKFLILENGNILKWKMLNIFSLERKLYLVDFENSAFSKNKVKILNKKLIPNGY